jgi:two-component system phosphate regulon sensor histidine kinase PhoR
LLNKIKNTYQFHLSNKGFQFNVEIPEKNIFVEGDEEAVSEAILNLIDNAVKYSKDEKFVSVNLFEEEKRAVIEVVDKGIGIPKSEQEKIFEKFYRATKGLIHDTKGTGLGLALVKHIVEAHKGNIEIRSELGKGSKFKLSFPLYSEG